LPRTGLGDAVRKKSTVLQIRKDATVHSFAEEECMAFADFINTKLGAEPQLAYLLPIREISELFSVVADGVLFCKLINLAEAEAAGRPSNRGRHLGATWASLISALHPQGYRVRLVSQG